MFEEKAPSFTGMLLRWMGLERVGEKTTELNSFGDEDEGGETGQEYRRGDEYLLLWLLPSFIVFGVDYFEEGEWIRLDCRGWGGGLLRWGSWCHCYVRGT